MFALVLYVFLCTFLTSLVVSSSAVDCLQRVPLCVQWDTQLCSLTQSGRYVDSFVMVCATSVFRR